MHIFFTRLAAALLSVFILSGTAHAHSKVKAAHPETGATVAAGLEEVTLNFSRNVMVTVLRLVRLPEGAEPVSGISLPDNMPEGSDLAHNYIRKAPKFSKALSVTLEPLAPGLYAYDWTGFAKDGHKMTGFSHFIVAE